MYSLHMNRDAHNLVDVQWLARCANRLRQEWPRAEVASIDETALELWGAHGAALVPEERSTTVQRKVDPDVQGLLPSQLYSVARKSPSWTRK